MQFKHETVFKLQGDFHSKLTIKIFLSCASVRSANNLNAHECKPWMLSVKPPMLNFTHCTLLRKILILTFFTFSQIAVNLHYSGTEHVHMMKLKRKKRQSELTIRAYIYFLVPNTNNIEISKFDSNSIWSRLESMRIFVPNQTHTRGWQASPDTRPLSPFSKMLDPPIMFWFRGWTENNDKIYNIPKEILQTTRALPQFQLSYFPQNGSHILKCSMCFCPLQSLTLIYTYHCPSTWNMTNILSLRSFICHFQKSSLVSFSFR